jgi:hypothetical protein
MIDQIVNFAVENPATAMGAVFVISTILKLVALKVAVRMLNE